MTQALRLLQNPGACPGQGRHCPVGQKVTRRCFHAFLAVLPKFEVTLKAPKIITIEAQELEVTACGV